MNPAMGLAHVVLLALGGVGVLGSVIAGLYLMARLNQRASAAGHRPGTWPVVAVIGGVVLAVVAVPLALFVIAGIGMNLVATTSPSVDHAPPVQVGQPAGVPPTLSVPGLLGLPVADASQQLVQQGLVVSTVTGDRASGVAPGTVTAQSPAEFTVVPVGSVVTLTVAPEDPTGQVSPQASPAATP